MIRQVDYFAIPQTPALGIDIETTMNYGKNSDPFRDEIVSIQVSDGKNVWVCTNPEGYASLVPVLESPDVIKIFHNAAFDLQFLIQKLGLYDLRGIPNKDSIWDSLIMERVIHAGKKIDHGLADVLARRMGIMLDKSIRKTFSDTEGGLTEVQLGYVAGDVLHLPRLREMQMADLSSVGLGRVAGLENSLTPTIARMSLTGIGFDKALWQSYIPQIRKMLEEIESWLGDQINLPVQNTLFGGPRLTINIASSDQLLTLFGQLGIKLDTTNKNAIASFLFNNEDHPHREVLLKIVEWRMWNHMLSTPYTNEVNPATGRIHCSWNQVGAATGRFSSSGPNMQNPQRPSEGKPNIRLLFTPLEDHVFVIMDYNQQEPRIYAQISEDKALRQACSQADVYIAMAEEIEGRKVEKSDPARQKTKTGVLADFYGIMPENLAARMGITLAAANDYHRRIEQKFAQAKRWSTRTKAAVQTTGMTKTILGRIRYYPEFADKNLSYKMLNHLLNEAVNMPIQGSGADMLKLALNEFDTRCQRLQLKAHPCLVVHDEIVVQCPRSEAEMVFRELKESMERVGKMLCPDVAIIAEGIISDRWSK